MYFNVDDLIEQRLVTQKLSPCGQYRLFKYSRNVFYSNLWHLDPRIKECRGIVVDRDNKVVMHPFTKVFNYGENNTGLDIDPKKKVEIVTKLNGFLAQAAMVHGKMIVTSSGSFTGDFQELAEKEIKSCLSKAYRNSLSKGIDFMFEICHESDPHIVQESPGVYLIGARNISTGEMVSEGDLDDVAFYFGFERPEHCFVNFHSAIALSRKVKHEGFMVRDPLTGETLLKLKSKHYLNKKALMRLGKAKIEALFDSPQNFRQRLDEEFYGVFEAIVAAGRDHWKALDEQGRRSFIEEYFDAHNL